MKETPMCKKNSCAWFCPWMGWEISSFLYLTLEIHSLHPERSGPAIYLASRFPVGGLSLGWLVERFKNNQEVINKIFMCESFHCTRTYGLVVDVYLDVVSFCSRDCMYIWTVWSCNVYIYNNIFWGGDVSPQ